MNYKDKEKAKFRRTARWKQFKERMRERSGGKDYITGQRLHRGWQLHHMDLNFENYQKLSVKRFICLNPQTHRVLHFIFQFRKPLELLKRLENAIIEMEKINGKLEEVVD